MNKIVYFVVLIWSISALAGCYQPQKQVRPPTPQRTYQGTVSPSVPTYDRSGQQYQTSPKVIQQPRYLDISGGEDLTMEDVAQDVELPSMGYLNDRIFEYGRKLDRWKDLDNQSLALNLSQEETEQMVRCFRRLQKVLNGYGTLRDDLLKGEQSEKELEYSEVFRGLQQQDIEFLESPCGRLLTGTEDKSAGWGQREESADLSQLETLIDRYASNKEYEEVVQVWLQIPQAQVDRVGLRAKILYANALMFLHQEGEAAEVYQGIVNQMSASEEQSTDLISLRKMLADLYTAGGNYTAAENQYIKISEDYQNLGSIEEWSNLQRSILERSQKDSPELKEYSELLKHYLGFIPEQDGYQVVWRAEKFLVNYPYSAVSSNVDIIKVRAQEKADKWLQGFVEQVDQLATEKKYVEAMELLDTMPGDLISEEQLNAFKAKKDELLLAEAVERETQKLARVQELQRQWNSGMLLVKEEKYEEAIALFSEMRDTEYAVKAENKITEVSLLAAKADRRKAADLFIRFTKTPDIDSKKKLLLESRRLLKNILVKYPEVEITEKVIGNIQRVEQEMNALDPNLLMMADDQVMVEETAVPDAFDMTDQTPPVPLQQETVIEEDFD